MPDRIKKILIGNFTNIEQEVKNIPHSFCTDSLIVIDFDEVKNKFCDQLGFNDKLCSCDCLYIDIAKNQMIFIEMKNFDISLIRNRGKYSDFSKFEEAFKLKINSGNFDDKIIDSYALILSIAGYYNIDKNFYSTILNIKNKIIKYIIIVNINYSDYLQLQLSSLGYFQSRYKYRFINKTSLVTSKDFSKLLTSI